MSFVLLHRLCIRMTSGLTIMRFISLRWAQDALGPLSSKPTSEELNKVWAQ